MPSAQIVKIFYQNFHHFGVVLCTQHIKRSMEKTKPIEKFVTISSEVLA